MTTQVPYLSIITINRNDASGLATTLENVWGHQKYDSFEHIVIDGNSTDSSVDVIKEYQDRLAYWSSEPDTGIYNAMNKGIAKARGEYLLFLNSGDWLVDDVLSRALSIPFSADIVYGDRYVHFSADKIVLERFDQPLTLLFFLTNAMPHQSTFMRRSLFEKYQYNEQYRVVSDWEFLLRKIIFENCSTNYIPIPICYFNMYGMSSKSENLQLHNDERDDVYRRLIPPLCYADYKMFIKDRQILSECGLMTILPKLQNRGSLSRKVGRAARTIISCNEKVHQLLNIFKAKKR